LGTFDEITVDKKYHPTVPLGLTAILLPLEKFTKTYLPDQLKERNGRRFWKRSVYDQPTVLQGKDTSTPTKEFIKI
jgi:hypothetical protein